ncbi:MAG: hypothetical protein WCD56_06915, partial [Pseudolabrys sp.]
TTVEPSGKLRPHGIDLRHDALDAFAVASIGNAFAAAASLAIAQFRNHDYGFGFGATADAKGTCDRPALGG